MLPNCYVQELVYDGEAVSWITERWPATHIEDARDMVHDDRWEVYVIGATEDDFYPVVMAEGWAGCCLRFELMIRLPEHHDKVRRWLDEAKAMGAAA
jgi:hypothetical protein